MEFVSADNVVLAAVRAGAEVRSVIGLEPLAGVRTEREIRVWIDAGQRNIFEFVEGLTRHAWIREHRPVFLKSVEHNSGPLRRGVVSAHGRSGQTNPGERRRQRCKDSFW